MNDWAACGILYRKACAAAGTRPAVWETPDALAKAQAGAFLEQGRALDVMIKLHLQQLGELPASDPALSTLREEILAQVAELKRVRAQIAAVIERVPKQDDRLALSSRCLMHKTWIQIGLLLGIDERTAQRRYQRGLKHVALRMMLEAAQTPDMDISTEL